MLSENRKFQIRTVLAVFLGCAFSIPQVSGAELPPVRSGTHPRVLAHSAELEKLGVEARSAPTGSPLWRARENLFNWVRNGFAKGFPDCQNGADYCNLTHGERGHILTTAKNLVLAYKIAPEADKESFKKLAKLYSDAIIKVIMAPGADPGINGEKSMGARIAALGFFYDWMYVEFEADRPQIRAAILKTIMTDRKKSDPETGAIIDDTDDLIGYICGGPFDDAKLTCKTEPNYKSDAYPSIARGYLGGHHATAAMNTLTALLAIYDEARESRALMEIIFKHFDEGIYPARADVSKSGGHHMGYGYAATSTDFGDRIITWRKGFENPPITLDQDGKVLTKLFEADAHWHSEIIFPFIYGYRRDTKFPASGDNFEFSVRQMPRYTLHAAVSGENGYARQFYENEIVPYRDDNTHRDLLWDRLLYPALPGAEAIADLPLARWFKRSGQVLMRDSWDNNLATLLEFKSSEFISRNHHHLDQNSFSIYYKEPLLVDSGAYDDYETEHWRNYYSRTIAHNTITVMNPNENFLLGDYSYINDGGQWFMGKETQPLLSEIQAAGKNALQGVYSFEDKSNYTYASGNASKAYWSRKLEQTDGFIREILFLRSANTAGAPRSSKPIIVVNDKVRTRPLTDEAGDQRLTAKSLFHFVGLPVTGSRPVYNDKGVYTLVFPDEGDRKITSRNSAAMITAEILLPLSTEVKLIGGPLEGDPSCAQFPEAVPVGVVKDCRFLVEKSPGQWVNYYPRKNLSADSGSWRIEIQGKLDAAKENQNFLTVFSVGDKDNLTEVPANLAEARILTSERVPGDSSAAGHVVQINNDRVVVFNSGRTASTAYQWSGGPTIGEAILTGMAPNTKFSITRTSLGRYTVTKNSVGSYAVTSSAEGIVSFILEKASIL